MAAAVGPQTPQRPVPGGFLQTPAPAPSILAQHAASLRQPHPSSASSQSVIAPAPAAPSTTDLKPVVRAARAINETLAVEARFPEFESYVQQGTSSDYEIPTNPAWAPFHRPQAFDLPTRILEQANMAGMEMQLGMFAPLGHAFIILDNCLYLWDYTVPNPELVGWEEGSSPITAVKLAAPKPGVFIAQITHVIIVATTTEVLLLGVASNITPTGAKTIALYNTRMSVPLRGMGTVQCIEASDRTGRIFFSASAGEDVFEFQYQQEEGWFSGKTKLLCHTKNGVSVAGMTLGAVGSLWGSTKSKPKQIRQLLVDDSRGLMYSLSDTSELRIWAITPDGLRLCISRSLQVLIQGTGHFTARSELLIGIGVRLVRLAALPASESSRLSLMAVTNTGCRLYMSATQGYAGQADANRPPSSIAIMHIRYPPREPRTSPTQLDGTQITVSSSAVAAPNSQINSVDSASQLLMHSSTGVRYPPGYFVDIVPDPTDASKDRAFVTAIDSARLKNGADTSNLNTRFSEFGQWIHLPSAVEQIVSLTPQFEGASGPVPLGFGNELAVQFDRPAAELAIISRSGIQTFRRKRLVDTFAGIIRYGSSAADEDGLEGDIKRFVRQYGRGETAATALAVACGQGVDVDGSDRTSRVSDPEILEGARKVYIEQGGKAEFLANAVLDGAPPVDGVRPSPRHEGTALYISRLVRSIWKQNIIKTADGAPSASSIPPPKLRSVQKDLNGLSEFLNKNKTFIEGLGGPQALGRMQPRQEEISLQGEHRAMTSLLSLVASIIEGISFVLVLFDENLDEILLRLSDESRRLVKELTYEGLFVSNNGREIAKELVKAIVDRNIANGSNVDTVAEALRRRCGSFCSSEDVVIFKAQEQVKRAGEVGAQTETGRVLLNESQRLFSKVAENLPMDILHWAAGQYCIGAFYAGAIQLCLAVADEKDKGKRAASWLRDGSPDGDERRSAHEARKPIYGLIFSIIHDLDRATAQTPQTLDGTYTLAAKRRQEAYEVIDGSDDTVFQTSLYDWYMEVELADRLLDIQSPHAVEYLRRRSRDNRAAADMLWKYFAHHSDYLEAAAVQLDLARGFFELNLETRISYLSLARTNASTRQSALLESRQSRQQLLREISDLLDVANIQDDILQRMKSDQRLTGERREQVLTLLDGSIISLAELFNHFADQADYHDICIQIYQVADHRNPQDIRTSWQNLINQTHEQAPIRYGKERSRWEVVGTQVQELGRRLMQGSGDTAPATFPIQTLLPMLERYAIEPRDSKPSEAWALSVFLELGIPHETLLPVLEALYYSNEAPFVGSKRKIIANHMVYLLLKWAQESDRKGERILFGSEENASVVRDCLTTLLRETGNLDTSWRQQALDLTNGIARAIA
ncbi:non-repetitive nucleoporin [Polychaeton citri CBS 116435]|uniref:Non-repetitive nucleoporin n=1 Tax=Polychaeton citri CBS 116435 TaxID=1314669 RepID=A0A9P4QAY4_9PEZI|nr:non-repetitive nucleoporin [Polychaeton citri CBS 116435]